jgi:hypothetical protein
VVPCSPSLCIWPHGDASSPLLSVQALDMLAESEENARLGKHQYLSGVLHNVAKILANDPVPSSAEEALQEYGFGSGAHLLNHTAFPRTCEQFRSGS